MLPPLRHADNLNRRLRRRRVPCLYTANCGQHDIFGMNAGVFLFMRASIQTMNAGAPACPLLGESCVAKLNNRKPTLAR